jgi:hypothetical protein
MLRVLSLLEARVLGVLVEKERTVPDSYPLTLNALVAGCNETSPTWRRPRLFLGPVGSDWGRRPDLETELSKLARFGGGKDIKFSGGFELKPRAA